MPDFLGLFGDGAVGAEFAGVGDVHQAHAGPAGGLFVGFRDLGVLGGAGGEFVEDADGGAVPIYCAAAIRWSVSRKGACPPNSPKTTACIEASHCGAELPGSFESSDKASKRDFVSSSRWTTLDRPTGEREASPWAMVMACPRKLVAPLAHFWT